MTGKSSVDRRSFLKLSAGGALVATAALPSVAAEEKKDVFPGRGQFERLALGYAVVKAGATKPFSVLHISDTHLTAAFDDESGKKQTLRKIRMQTFGGHQEEALRDSLAWAKKNVDYVVHTGDLIDWQSRANLALVKKYFGPNMVGSMGNHEFSPDMWLSEPKCTNDEAFKEPSRKMLADAYPFDISFASQVVNGVNFVTLDDVYGTVTPEQVERFRAEVKKGLPIVLCMHVPFYTDEIRLCTEKFWIEGGGRFTNATLPPRTGDSLRQQTDPTTRDFIASLKREPLLKAILAGHLHITIQERFSPTAIQYVVGGNFLFHGEEILII